jgi:polyisoprenoid-binding protein YceI
MKRIALLATLIACTGTFAHGFQPPLGTESARVTIAGTSNVHDYTASSTEVRITRAAFSVAATSPTFWDDAQKPGGLEAFDVAISSLSLKSTKDGLDKNMHKALKATEHKDITFSLKRMTGEPGALKAIGLLKIAGVEREVTLPLKTSRKGAGLLVAGSIDMLMTDYGIAPPKAMLGMVKASPKVTVSFEVVLVVS